ncbi:hypothetical protein ACJIZ3_022837 [Penstemon smallii]|uniref:Glycosyltransferase n=1 Tax=Penstemon smallii TaxID=265156 RepID=A0ABD3TNP8_9LAMI
MDSEEQSFKILLFPWLAHGHISPFLQLSKKLSQQNFQIYICSTPINLNSIKNKIPQKYNLKIHLLELNLPSSQELPPHYHTTNGLPLHLNPKLRKALKMSKPNLSNILKSLKPDMLIYDIVQPWAAKLALEQNIPSVLFITSGAFMFSYFCHLGRRPGSEFPFPGMKLTDFELSMALEILASVKNEEKDPDDEIIQRKDGIVLMNTSREIEGKFIDYVSELINWNIVPTGVMIQEPSICEENDDEVLKWLAEKDEFSTVYVSFGSEYFLKKEDIQEIAYGLELSNVDFIWVIRSPKGEEIEVAEVLPEGFLERVGEKGKILEKWAPQAKILSHGSVGGFLSHCGWNSLMESIDFRVPIIGMPMQLDQPLCAKLVVELGVGVDVVRDEKGKFGREEISRMVKDVVFEGRGDVLRKKIGEVREKVRLRSSEEIDGVVEKLIEICGKSS